MHDDPPHPPASPPFAGVPPQGPGPARPERPALGGHEPAPLSGPGAVPSAVRRTLRLWQASLTLTFFALVTMILTRGGLATHLEEALLERDPTFSVTVLETATRRVVLGVVAVLAVVLVLELALVRALSGRHTWPRFVTVPVVLLHLVVAVLASLLVPGTAWQGWLLTATLFLGVAVALAAVIGSFAPGFSAWVHRREPPEDVS
ncbi:hypothetical protein GCM10023168_14890 [Fodinibacter luteus]|uniref:Integral membrane protein n=1 Tax=Fodinibacter luteus TaxID=552064 RepID=A0ABP8KBW5_9MICO